MPRLLTLFVVCAWSGIALGDDQVKPPKVPTPAEAKVQAESALKLILLQQQKTELTIKQAQRQEEVTKAQAKAAAEARKSYKGSDGKKFDDAIAAAAAIAKSAAEPLKDLEDRVGMCESGIIGGEALMEEATRRTHPLGIIEAYTAARILMGETREDFAKIEASAGKAVELQKKAQDAYKAAAELAKESVQSREPVGQRRPVR
jgi:hypothetical protein